jgi:hypothetical protein
MSTYTLYVASLETIKMEKTIPAKLELSDLLYVGLVMAVLGIVLAFSADVQDDIASDFTADSYAKNISDKALEGSYNLTKKVPTVGTVAAIVVILGILIGGFGTYMKFR